MWIKHLAQCLTYSPRVRNASCECHLLNKCLWKEGGKEGRRETAGRRKKVSYPISRPRFTSELKGKCPLPCISGTISLGLVSPSGCFGGPEVSCWVQCQPMLPGQGVRGRSICCLNNAMMIIEKKHERQKEFLLNWMEPRGLYNLNALWGEIWLWLRPASEMDFGIFWLRVKNALSCSISFPTCQIQAGWKLLYLEHTIFSPFLYFFRINFVLKLIETTTPSGCLCIGSQDF